MSKNKIIFPPDNNPSATLSLVPINECDDHHEILIGSTHYGKGHTPAGGHQPITTIEYITTKSAEAEDSKTR